MQKAKVRKVSMDTLTSNLPEERREQLCASLGNVELTLLYKASVHGYNASAFHQRCDRQGPTLLVAYNRSGYIFGGYTSVDYTQSGRDITDEEAFLFSFQGGTCSYIKVNSGYNARYDDAQGPNFGQQLYFCYNNQPVVYYQGGSAFNINTSSIYGKDTQLSECEVYKVEQEPQASIEEKPWRKVLWTAERKDELMKMIRNHKPLMASVSRFRTYPVKDGREGKPLPFVLCDTMGLEERSGAGLDIEDISSILQGHVPDRYKFNPMAPFQPDEQKASKPASLQEKIHCVVYVIDATKISLMSDKLEEKHAAIRRKVNSLGIAQIVLMTKVDEACSLVEEDLQSIYVSSYIKAKVQEVSSRLGVPVSCVLPVKNYSQELELELNCDVLLLTALQQMLRFADDYFDDIRPVEGKPI
ncbi:interferon-induced protein 44-like isoform X2 [Chanodichthys erythropterus]|uniref:interferon-induced protein 44-like isoform X2 n=1 Tax=Chanodichthys erythropterus TaxID=933992 RepID=UPI00351ED77D